MKNLIKNGLNLFLFLTTWSCFASLEYVYPVAQLDEQNLLILYQKSMDDLELWIWNRDQKLAFKELSSVFLPTSVQLLPSKTAYSFIDRGRIRVKSLKKRAPRAIDIYEPIHAIISMTWINDEQFYFVGKHEDTFNIFFCDTTDRSSRIFCLNNFDDYINYSYPCKINQSLFCITRNLQEQYSIVRLSWDPKPYQEVLCSKIKLRQIQVQENGLRGFYASFTSLNANPSESDILLTQVKPLCFLSMQNEQMGFVLELEGQDNEVLEFTCCKVETGSGLDNDWKLSKLFNFQLPKKILVGSQPERIYESIHPFLPVYTSDWIYFVNYQAEANQCSVQRYNRSTQTVELSTSSQSSLREIAYVFAPYLVDNRLYCGMSTMPNFRNSSLLSIDQMTGLLRCQLPEIAL